MTEFIGNISDEYDAKYAVSLFQEVLLFTQQSLHSHESDAYQKFVLSQQRLYKIGEGNLAFMI
jgi:hypothetical protein